MAGTYYNASAGIKRPGQQPPMGMIPGYNLGGGVAPGHTLRNTVPASTVGAYQTPHRRQPSRRPTLMQSMGLDLPKNFMKLPKINKQLKNQQDGMAPLQMPEFPQPHVTGAIDFPPLAQGFLPQSVVDTGVAQAQGKLFQQANPQPMFEQFGADQSNQASAASGQYFPMVMAQMQDPLQQAAALQGMAPAQAALDRYQFGTQGLGAAADERQRLMGMGMQWGADRLQNFNQELAQRDAILGLLRGGGRYA